MTTWIIKNKNLENWLEGWKKGVLKNVGDRDLLVSNNVNGTYNSPSKRKDFFQTAGFAIASDVLKDESIKPFLNAITFGFYFIEKDIVAK